MDKSIADSALRKMGHGERWYDGRVRPNTGMDCLYTCRAWNPWQLEELLNAIEALFPERVKGVFSASAGVPRPFHKIVAFNDHPQTIWEDVALVLKHVST